MERAVAIKKLTKILGKHLAWELKPNAPKQEERDEAFAKLKQERPKREALSKAMADRTAELLAGDSEYQRLKAEHAAVKKVCDELSWTCNHYRVTVGTMGELFFSVKAQGDSWEDVIAKLTAKEKAQ